MDDALEPGRSPASAEAAEPVPGPPPEADEEEDSRLASMMQRLFPQIEQPRDRWVELVAAVLLALATVLTAWSGYQATRWSGTQATAFSRAGALRSESLRATTQGGQRVTIDVQTFVAWVDAVSSGDQRRADFLRARFRAEFVPAFEEWVASAPGGPGGKIPPGTPFDLPSYRVADLVKADRLERQASASFAQATDANQTGDNFVLTAVLFASVLFFAGIGTKWRSFRLRVFSLILAGVAFVTGVAIVASLPPNVGF